MQPDISHKVIVIKTQYERHAGDNHQKHNQNLMLNVVLKAIEKQREFFGAIAEKFAHTFKNEKSKFVDAVEVWEKNRKTLL